MLTHWNKLLTTDCKVVKIKNEYIYPIFKNGSTTLHNNAEKVYKNNELKKLKEITVYIRNAKDRFTSGVNTYAEQNNKEIKTVIKQISDNKLCNRHFAPQFIWLFHLYKYFRGTINLKPLEQLQLEKANQSKNITKITDVNNYLLVDNKLIEKYNNKSTALKIIIEDLIHVLS